MAKWASIFIKLGRKVVLMMFFKNQLVNGCSHGHSELQNAKYIDFFIVFRQKVHFKNGLIQRER